MNYSTYTPFKKPSYIQKGKIVDFLFQHLDQYGDPKEAIRKCLDYSMKEVSSHGGFIILAHENETITGAVIVNKTGMEDYIPENILVYIAVNGKYRGQGIGKELMKKAIQQAEGDIALHVEPDNPAKILYEKIGFTNKYLEMRYTKSRPKGADKGTGVESESE